MAAEEMKVKVDTGAINVILRDEFNDEIGSFKFIPTDLNIAERYENMIEEVEKIAVDEKSGLEGFKAISNRIEELFDYLLNYKVSESLFKVCNPLTPTKNGDFYFETCLETIADIIENTFEKRLEKKKARINKATAKYTKK